MLVHSINLGYQTVLHKYSNTQSHTPYICLKCQSMLPKPSSLSRQPQKWNVTKPCPGHPLYYYTRRGKKTLWKDGDLIRWPHPEIERTKPTSHPLIQIRGRAASPLPANTQPCFCSSFGLHPQMFHLGLMLILSRNEHTPRLSSIKAKTIRKMHERHIGQMFLWAVSSVPPLTFRCTWEIYI